VVTDELQPLHPRREETVARTRGGDVTVGADGTRVITTPWPDYTRTIPDFWDALTGVPGWSHGNTQDYLGVVRRWRESEKLDTILPEHLERMDRATLLNFLRWIDRGERFCDGHWSSAFKGGLFHAAARALIASA
jgi:hypothetical protein